ncbi:MAG: hypothetical protein U5K56_13135 [Halioglobus sp.]|nr:hypothetical protein [Halioglobus sp.]
MNGNRALFALVLLLASFSAKASLFTYDVTYDGSSFSFAGGNSWDGLAFTVGDSLDITLSADTGDHWEWLQDTTRLWYANIYDSSGQNTGSYNWTTSYNGSTVGTGGAESQQQGNIHIGPRLNGGLEGSVGDIFDEYRFEYTFEGSDDTQLDIENENFGINYMLGDSLYIHAWTFNDGARFQYVDANEVQATVSAPFPLALIALGLIGVAVTTRRKAS